MNTSRLRKIFMCALPVAAAIFAAMPGTVQVIKGTEVASSSYLVAIPVGLAGLCAPVAVILNYVTFACVVFAILARKKGGYTAAAGASFLSSLAAVGPLFLQNGEVRIIPHVVFPILTLAEALFVYYCVKTGKKENGPQGKHLEIH